MGKSGRFKAVANSLKGITDIARVKAPAGVPLKKDEPGATGKLSPMPTLSPKPEPKPVPEPEPEVEDVATDDGPDYSMERVQRKLAKRKEQIKEIGRTSWKGFTVVKLAAVAVGGTFWHFGREMKRKRRGFVVEPQQLKGDVLVEDKDESIFLLNERQNVKVRKADLRRAA